MSGPFTGHSGFGLAGDFGFAAVVEPAEPGLSFVCFASTVSRRALLPWEAAVAALGTPDTRAAAARIAIGHTNRIRDAGSGMGERNEFCHRNASDSVQTA